MNKENSLTPMLNLYPDSMGGTLKDVTQFLASDDLKDSFGSIYILPSIQRSWNAPTATRRTWRSVRRQT